MPGPILTVGEILVEIIATTKGEGFREPIELVGPFPSGAPAIFIDQVARLGHPCAMIGCVGDDDFGRLNIDRLRGDGVDVSAIRVDPEAVTGSAFVRYRPDGQRDFVFNIKDSAAVRLSRTPEAEAVVAAAGHLHVVGSSLLTPAMIDLVLSAAGEVKAAGGTVSLDPNLRKEIFGPALQTALGRLLEHTDLLLPSGDELLLFADTADVGVAIKSLLDRSIGAVVHKRGASGARYVSHTEDVFAPGFAVKEIDPTGAGDVFGATFVAGWLSGLDSADNLRRANAAGALAVTRRGPMEGVSTATEIDAFIAAQAST